MMMKTRGDGVEFWIGGPGEEVHGTSTALALHRAVGRGALRAGDIGLFLHYRSDALAAMTTAPSLIHSPHTPACTCHAITRSASPIDFKCS